MVGGRWSVDLIKPTINCIINNKPSILLLDTELQVSDINKDEKTRLHKT